MNYKTSDLSIFYPLHCIYVYIEKILLNVEKLFTQYVNNSYLFAYLQSSKIS